MNSFEPHNEAILVIGMLKYIFIATIECILYLPLSIY